MVRNFLEGNLEDCENMHDGIGVLKHKNLFKGSDFKTPIKFFNYTVLPPNTTIGVHTHGNDEELYILLEGDGKMIIDGEERTVCTGDIILNKPYGTHELINSSDKDIKMLVLGIGV